MEQVVTHYGETIQEHSVEWYKKQLLKDWSVQFIKDSLLPQLFEWSNAYKAAVELTKKEANMKTTTEAIEEGETFVETFVKTKVLDIDTFVTVSDEKTFDTEGKRVGFIRTEIFQDYTGKISVRTNVIQ